MTRQEFIAAIADGVKKYAPQYGIKVYSPIIAQAILVQDVQEVLFNMI